MGRKLTTEEFIQRSKKVHSGKYSYEKCIYVNKRTKVTLKCNQCSQYFDTSPQRHVDRGHGCPDCGKLNKRTTVSNTSEFVAKALATHGSKYKYEKCMYKTSKEKVIITCPVHGDFKQTPQSHLAGSGCPHCSKRGFKVNKPAILYYLSVLNGIAYKIGITNESVEKRFNHADMDIITVLKVWEFKDGQECLDKEQEILKEFKDSRYSGDPLLKNGNSELFKYDILGLDGLPELESGADPSQGSVLSS